MKYNIIKMRGSWSLRGMTTWTERRILKCQGGAETTQQEEEKNENKTVADEAI